MEKTCDVCNGMGQNLDAYNNPDDCQACNGVGYIEYDEQKPPKVQPFSKMDWNGFAGAEPFADGSEPLISYHLKVSDWIDGTKDYEQGCDCDIVIIVDANGIGLCGMDSFMQLDVTNRFVATVFANELLSHTWKVEGLLKIGFELV